MSTETACPRCRKKFPNDRHLPDMVPIQTGFWHCPKCDWVLEMHEGRVQWFDPNSNACPVAWVSRPQFSKAPNIP